MVWGYVLFPEADDSNRIYIKKIPGNISKSPNSSSLSNVISGLKTTIDQQWNEHIARRLQSILVYCSCPQSLLKKAQNENRS